MGQSRLSKNNLLVAGAILLVCVAVTFAYLKMRGNEGARIATADHAKTGQPAGTKTDSKSPAGRLSPSRDTIGQQPSGAGSQDSKPGTADPAKQEEDAEAAALEARTVTQAKMQDMLGFRQAPTAEAVEILTKYLDDQDRAVQSEALDTLGVIGQMDSELKETIRGVLLVKATDQDYPLRGEALITAAFLGENEALFPVIEDYIAEPGDDGKRYAVRAMVFLPQCVNCTGLVEQVLAATDDKEIRKTALKILSDGGTPQGVALLEQELSSKDAQQQASSAWALAVKNDSAYNRILSDAMARDELDYEALRIIATSAAAPEVFGTVLQSENTSNASLKAYLNLLADNTSLASREVRNGVAESIKPLLKSSDANIQTAAIEALGKVHPSDDQTEALEPALESGSFEVQQAALNAYRTYMTPKTYKPLIKLWYDDDQKIRRTAFALSSAFLNTSDIPDLEKATSHSDQLIAKQSKLTLKQIRDMASIRGGGNQ